MRRRKMDAMCGKEEWFNGAVSGCESFAGYVTFTRNVELLAYHA